MKLRILKIMLAVIFCININLFAQDEKTSFDIEKEKGVVEKTIVSSIGWVLNKDINLLYSIIANDSNFVEVSPNKRIVKSFEDFKKAESFWMSPDFKPLQYNIWDIEINFSQTGNTAWFFCMLNDFNEWKGQPANWENTRWTGVLEKRDGKWVIVQMHFSFAAE